MLRMMLKSKIHRATVTDANLEYEGSVTIDEALLKSADIWEYERVEIYNITNGSRFATYAIPGPANSGVICINGAAAHLTKPGDLVIICSYVHFEESQIQNYSPKVLLVDSHNKAKQLKQ